MMPVLLHLLLDRLIHLPLHRKKNAVDTRSTRRRTIRKDTRKVKSTVRNIRRIRKENINRHANAGSVIFYLRYNILDSLEMSHANVF